MNKRIFLALLVVGMTLFFIALYGAASNEPQTTMHNFSVDRVTRASSIRLWEAQVTAYTNGPESTGKTPEHPAYGITSSGVRTHWGTCAADPSVPYGTVLWIPGYGYCIVEDRGGLIKGDIIDIWIPEVEDALQWGRQNLTVEVLRWGFGGRE